MRYTDSTLLDRLASEYVLGTLRGAARRRFERLLIESNDVRQAALKWQQHLMPLLSAVSPVQPSPHSWQRILQRTGGLSQPEPSWLERLSLWRAWSLVATVALLVLTITLVFKTFTPEPAQFVAVFNDEKSQPLWVVKADSQRARLSIRPIHALAPKANSSYELWLLPQDGGAPRSLGLLPLDGTLHREFSRNLVRLLATAKGLAISVEPQGGSPTGAPTGPVINVAALVRL